MKINPRAFQGLSRFLAPSAGGPLADRALREKLISVEQLDECIRDQERSGRPLDELLVERGYLKLEDVTRLRQPSVPAEVVEAMADPERIISQYVLVSILGTGGMGAVWKAWDRTLVRWVAVKCLKPEVGHPTQRLDREGRMAGGLSHPNIISIFERGQHEGRPYLVMPFMDAAPPRPPLPPREAARVASEVARALAYAHQKGVIHRDVKPANILIDEGGRVLLTDFGLAIPGDAATSKWAISGTPEYASPEQIRGEALDATTDIYSLGASLYELLSGTPPFRGRNPQEIADQVLRGGPPPLRGVPASLRRIVGKAMHLDRARRHPTMEEFAEALDRFRAGSGVGALLRPGALAVVLLAGLLSSAITYALLIRGREDVDQTAVYEALKAGQEALSRAEQMRADPGVAKKEIVTAAARAVPHFMFAIRLARGTLPEASAGLGRCHEIMGQEDRAEADYLTAGDHPKARLGRARITLRRGLDGRGRGEWRRRAVEDLRPIASTEVGAALTHFLEGRWAEALAAAPSAVARDRYDETLYLAMGIAAIERNAWDAAIPYLEQAVRLRDGDATSWYYKGLALAGRGDAEEALDALRRARSLASPGWGHLKDTERRLED